MRLTALVDFGKDAGQSFGALFEGRNAEGRVVIGAGFADVYNTRLRSDRFAVQFFVRPAQGENTFTTELLPRPSPDGGVYMYSLDGTLYALAHVHDRTWRSWDPSARAWKVAPQFDPGAAEANPNGIGLGSGASVPPSLTASLAASDALVRVGGGILKFAGSRVTFNDRSVLEPPEKGAYCNFYYGLGHLVFFHTFRAEPSDFTRLYACPWDPDQEGPADLSKARVLQLTVAGDFPFAYGQLGRKLLTCSNLGGLYVFDGRDWSTLRTPEKGVSYQIYSMIVHYDRLLMAQYPSGELFAYDGEKVTQLSGWPPRIAGVSPHAREAQTTMIYRGDLFVGVWPWGELWRYDADAAQWLSLGRMFRLPPVTDTVGHPFEKEINDYNAANGTKIVFNDWGQRVTGMAPLGADLLLSTSAKAPWRRETRFAFLTDEVWEQYGRVIRLTMPGNLTATVQWKGGPTQVQFVVGRDGMSILQDGVEKAAVPLDPALAARVRDLRVKWGYGVFGPFQGTLSKQTVE